MGENVWTDERIAELKRYWNEEGLSCSQIAAELGNGISRNAVIGKLHRLGINSDNRPAKQARAPQRERSSEPTPRRRFKSVLSEPLPDLRTVELESRNLSIMDLEPNDCRWPYGEQDITFCGHPKHQSSSYCPAHFRLSLRIGHSLTEADHERRRRHFIKLQGLNTRSAVASTWLAEAAE